MGNLKNKLVGVVKVIIPCIEWSMALLCVFYSMIRGFGDLPITWIFNISADLICILVNLFLIMGIINGLNKLGERDVQFLVICHTSFLSLVLDFASWMLDGIGSEWVIMLINTLLYISNLLLCASYTRFIIDSIVESKKRKKYYYITYILLAITIITRLFNIKFGYFFTVSAEGVYSRGAYQYLSYIYTIFLQLMVVMILLKSKASTSQKRAVLAFTILPFLAAVASIFIYGLSLMYACVLISIVMIYSAFFVELEEGKGRLIENFEKYISNDIVQKIVNNPSDKLIEGRRYTATVLLSDIRGFTAFSDSMKAEDLVNMLNHYYGIVTDIIYSYGGVVTEFLGDGIMCIFGAPNTIDDHADRAIAAALKIEESAQEINEWNKLNNYPEIHTGIGINTGTMVLGSLGNESHAKYTAVGQTIDRAFEIESCSIGGQVLISTAVLRATKSKIDSEFLCDILPDPTQLLKIQIYEVSHIYGEWNVGKARNQAPLKNLEKQVDINYCILNGKSVELEKYRGKIVKISIDAAVIIGEYLPQKLDNVQLNIPNVGVIYAKVEKATKEEIKVNFTSLPVLLEKWIKEIV